MGPIVECSSHLGVLALNGAGAVDSTNTRLSLDLQTSAALNSMVSRSADALSHILTVVYRVPTVARVGREDMLNFFVPLWLQRAHIYKLTNSAVYD